MKVWDFVRPEQIDALMSLMLTLAKRAGNLTWPMFLTYVKPRRPSVSRYLLLIMRTRTSRRTTTYLSNMTNVYLTAQKTSPSWKKVTTRKTVGVENDKVMQIKYIGDKDRAA